MKVSCIISTHNRETVYKTIKSLLKQTYPVEIIVIDDGSSKPVQFGDVAIIRNETPKGLSFCRNLGSESATGDIISFIDDDAIASPNWIEELIKSFNSQKVNIVGGLILPMWSKHRPWWLKNSLEYLIGVNEHSHAIFGCNFAITKKVFNEIKFVENLGRKYDNLVVGDESEFIFNALDKGYHTGFNENAKVYHIVSKQRLYFWYFIIRNIWEGRTETRRKRVKQHIFAKLFWLIEKIKLFFFSNDKSLNKRKLLSDILINSVLYFFYIFGIGFEYIYGDKDYNSYN